MRILLFGSNGMLGSALTKCLMKEHDLILATRSECDLACLDNIYHFVIKHKPDVVINCAAIVNINLCEVERELAVKVNSYSVAKMAEACNEISAKLLQISTDHYYMGDGAQRHTENDSVSLVNYYAHTKFLGEAYAALARNHLIIRTNIVGFRDSSGQIGFLEWALDNITNNKQFTLFHDYFTSSIDIYSFSDIMKNILHKDITGLYNVASCDVKSKAEFIELLSQRLSIPLNSPIYASVQDNNSGLVKRSNSLGLCVNKIQQCLCQEMPSISQIIDRIIGVYNERG